jgi:hypothetical protein
MSSMTISESREAEHAADTAFSGGGNSRMRLSADCLRVTIEPIAKESGGSFPAAVVHNHHFEGWRIGLVLQGMLALLKRDPVVINRYDNAE